MAKLRIGCDLTAGEGEKEAKTKDRQTRMSAPPGGGGLRSVGVDHSVLGMPQIRFDIISIGTLSRNRLWGETQAVRTAHATCTLIRSGKRTILVDPGLPGPARAARLFERTGLTPEQID